MKKFLPFISASPDAVLTMSFDKRKKGVVYTIEECLECGLKKKRSFQVGDFVYKNVGECPKCKGYTVIGMIYFEQLRK
jgi:rRNA maturation protein Nop10